MRAFIQSIIAFFAESVKWGKFLLQKNEFRAIIYNQKTEGECADAGYHKLTGGFYNIPKIKKQRIKVLLFQEKVSFLSQENQDHKGQIA